MRIITQSSILTILMLIFQDNITFYGYTACFKLKLKSKLGTGMKSYRNFRMNLNMLIKISKKKWTEKINERIATPHSSTLIVISIGLSLSALLHGCPSCHCLLEGGVCRGPIFVSGHSNSKDNDKAFHIFYF